MSGTLRDPARARTAAALASLLLFGLAGCGESPPGAPVTRGRGPLVSPSEALTACELARYTGPETRLYSDRPYHTTDLAAIAEGLAFCRAPRHGTRIWTLEIIAPTRLVVFGTRDNGLMERGWTPSDDPLEVAAAGVALDRIYTRSFPPGRFVIRQGYTPTAPIVLWDEAAAHVRP